MSGLTITIDPNKKCAECGNGGATDSGICLPCATKAIQGKPMRSTVGKMVQQRFRASK